MFSILVEDQGCVNYDYWFGEEKGLIGEIIFDGVFLVGWCFILLDVVELVVGVVVCVIVDGGGDGLSVWIVEFVLDVVVDFFFDILVWSKGFVFVNGFFFGWYWWNGLQWMFYVLELVIWVGVNSFVVLEFEQVFDLVVCFVGGFVFGVIEEQVFDVFCCCYVLEKCFYRVMEVLEILVFWICCQLWFFWVNVVFMVLGILCGGMGLVSQWQGLMCMRLILWVVVCVLYCYVLLSLLSYRRLFLLWVQMCVLFGVVVNCLS